MYRITSDQLCCQFTGHSLRYPPIYMGVSCSQHCQIMTQLEYIHCSSIRSDRGVRKGVPLCFGRYLRGWVRKGGGGEVGGGVKCSS